MTSIPAKGLIRGLEFFRRVLRLTSRSFAGIPSAAVLFCFSQNKANSGLSQFLHSLDVIPRTPTRNRPYAEKINKPLTSPFAGSGPIKWRNICRSAWSDCYKILIPYGALKRPMKLVKLEPSARFSGHQNFITANFGAHPKFATSGRRAANVTSSKIGWAVIAFCYLIAASAWAAGVREPEVKVRVSTHEIYIGDRIRYAIEVAADKGLEIGLPKFTDNRIGDFEIKDQGTSRKTRLFGAQNLTAWYVITAYEPGDRTIPSATVQYRVSGGQWASLRTKTDTVKVLSVLPKDGKVDDIKDIKGPIGYRQIKWFIILGVVVLALALAGAVKVYRYLKGRIVQKLPHEVALTALDEGLRALSKTGDVKEYYSGISDTIRRYIERIFSVRAPEMTTEEFLASLGDSTALSSHHKELLKLFLQACDLVKFAKYAPSSAEIDSVYAAAKMFIDETKEKSLALAGKKTVKV